MFRQEELRALKQFLTVVKSQPQVLHTPELLFFKEFIESYGGVIPPAPDRPSTTNIPKADEKRPESASAAHPEEEEEEIIESDLELDNTGVIDDPDPVPTSDDDISLDVEVCDEDMEKANEKKREGIRLYAEGEYEKAIETFNEAIKLNPGMALLYAKRGQCYLKLNKPNMCISDCTKALKVNPDNAAGYKYRGRAYRFLGHWLEAAKDLRSASKIDLDEEVDEWLKEVTPNARKIEEHQRKYERLRLERDIKDRQKRARTAREEHVKAAAGGWNQNQPPNFGGAAPGGKGDFKFPSEFMDLFSDPEIRKWLEDPEVVEAFTDISSNPSNMLKYANNPKVMSLIKKLGSKLDGGKGFPGGFPGGGFPGAGGFPGFNGGPSGGASPAGGGGVPDDIGLD